MRHVVYASASCVGAPRALCCWRWRWQLTYFCGARLPTQGLNVQVCSLCTASTVLANDCLISCEPVHVHHKHHHKHCVVGAGAGACAGDGECLTSCRAGHVQSKGPCNLEWLDGRGSPPVLVFGGETNAFGGKIYYTNSNAKTMISLCPVCGVQYISVAEFHTHTNSNDNTIISPYLVCGVQ